MAETEKTEEDLRAELRSLGYPEDGLERFVTGRLDASDAVPVLLRALPEITDPIVKEQIVRAVTMGKTKELAPDAASLLVREFERSDDRSLKWAIGNALSEVADRDDFDEVARIARDKRHGKAREMLAVALGNMKGEPRAADILIELLDDDETAGHAIIGLRKLKAKEAKDRIAAFREDDRQWVRREAKRTIASFEKT